jgi:hypothetical protein
MVVYILVYIKRGEDVECMAEVYFPRNGCVTSKNWEKMCTTDNGVDVDNRHDPIVVAVEIGLNYPHSIVGVRVVKGFVEFVDERARKELVSELEREK